MISREKPCGCYSGWISETDCKWYNYVCLSHKERIRAYASTLPKMVVPRGK